MARESVASKFCNRTYAHGIADWYNAHKAPAKIVWTVILLGALAAIAFFSYQMVAAYLLFQTVTQIREIRVDRMPFPNVTVCHSGRFNKSYIQETIQLPPAIQIPAGYDQTSIREEFVRYFATLAYQSVAFEEAVKPYLEKTYEYNFNGNSNGNPNALDVLEFLNSSAFHCPETVVRCYFNAKGFPCCNISRLVLSDYGMCYHLQPRNRDPTDLGQANQLLAGSTFAFTVTVQLVNNDQQTVQLEQGVNTEGVRVHLASYLEPDDDNAVLVLPGFHGYIRMNPTVRVTDPAIKPCIKSPVALAHHETYSKGLCQNECLVNFTLRNCSCAPAGYLAQIPSSAVCNPKKMLECVLPNIQKAKSDDEHPLRKCYTEQCPDYCSVWEYAPSITYTKTPFFVKGGSSLADSDGYEESGSRLLFSVFFSDLHYRQIEQQPLMDFGEFICNLGGMWGLWSGISVVGFIQCFYIVLCGYSEPEEEEEVTDWHKHEVAVPAVSTTQALPVSKI